MELRSSSQWKEIGQLKMCQLVNAWPRRDSGDALRHEEWQRNAAADVRPLEGL